jgi:gamma-glutamyltranspeptidase/glutathione hydrolase
MAKHGGLITMADLAAYRPVEREPWSGPIAATRSIRRRPPAPAAQPLINMLNILEHFDLKPLGAGSAASLHIMAETMKLGYATATARLAIPIS